MFDRPHLNAIAMFTAFALMVLFVSIGFAASQLFGGDGHSAWLCMSGDQGAQAVDHCTETLRASPRSTIGGKIHVISAFIALHMIAILSLIAAAFFVGRGDRPMTRMSLHVLGFVGFCALAGGAAWLALLFIDKVDGCRICHLMWGANFGLAAVVGTLQAIGAPNVWPWKEPFVGMQEHLMGFLIGALILAVGAAIVQYGSAPGGGSRPVSAPPTAPAVAAALGLPGLLPCDSPALVRRFVIEGDTSGAESPSSAPVAALLVDFTQPDYAKQLGRPLIEDLRQFVRSGGKLRVVHAATKADCYSESGSELASCKKLRTSMCLLGQLPEVDKWLAWLLKSNLRRPGGGQAANCDAQLNTDALNADRLFTARILEFQRNNGTKCKSKRGLAEVDCFGGAAGVVVGQPSNWRPRPRSSASPPVRQSPQFAVRSCISLVTK